LAVLVLAALLVAWLFYRPLRKTLQTLRSSDEALPKNESVSDWDLLNRSVLALSRDTVQFRKIIQIISPYVLRQLLCELVTFAVFLTATLQVSLVVLPFFVVTLQVTTAFPAFTAFTTPFLETVAMDFLLLDHFNFAFFPAFFTFRVFFCPT
jgi:hypothetical protein